ncbi:murein transglycosylase A, partial [Erwinia amylovora]|nr:murein transglycosylase A [Erwinia amylovora]
YKDGKLIQPLALVNQPNAKGRPVNGKDFDDQVAQIRFASAGLYSRQSVTYSAVQSWLMAGGDTRQLRQFGLNAFQMEGTDKYGNVQFTCYNTPVVQSR